MSALFSSLHLLALAIGLPAIFLRARFLHRAQESKDALAHGLRADGAWGIAALLWLGTGIPRAFMGLEKGTQYYLHNGMFHLKLALFGLVFLIELWPMITLIKLRVDQGKGRPLDLSRMRLIARISDVETLLVLAILFVAPLMARGVGM